MVTCPTHGARCRFYAHASADTIGLDLGYLDGWSNAQEFVAAHRDPIARSSLPVSDGRGDLFALGFLTGLIAGWCPVHEATNCLATHRCVVRVYPGERLRAAPHRLTIASIRLQGAPVDRGRNGYGTFPCGCECRAWDGAWLLCQYHEGYDDGVEAAIANPVDNA